MKRSRIPRTIETFASYIVLVNNYLHITQAGDTDPRGIVLGMTTAELAILDAFVKKLISGDPANPGIWDLHSNNDTKTQKTTAMMKEARKEFSAFFRPLLNRMNLSSKIVVGDRIPLEISDPVLKHTKLSKPIQESCFAKITGMTHGDLKLACRFASDGKRAGRPATANGVEVAFAIEIVDKGTGTGTQVSLIPQPDNFPTRRIFSKAKFVLSLGPDYVGKSVHIYVRWVNTKYPNFSGVWSTVNTVIVN